MSNPISESRARVLLRIPASLKARLSQLAAQEHRSLNKQIEFMLESAFQEGVQDGARESQRSKAEYGKRK
jgi:hypothetical protein